VSSISLPFLGPLREYSRISVLQSSLLTGLCRAEAGLDDLMSVRPNTGEDIEDVTAEGLMAVVNGTQKLF